MHLTGKWIQHDRRKMVATLADAPPLTVPFGKVEFLPDTVTATYTRTDAEPWALTEIRAEGGRLLKSGAASTVARHEGGWSRSDGQDSWFPLPDRWLLNFADQWSETFNHPNAWQG